MEKEIINKVFLQNCGDSLKVVKKTNIKQGTKYLWECEFQKYPCKILCLKGNILIGSIVNPQIEQVEFIDKLWKQNCGDTLKIVEKSDKKQNGTFLWKCEFQKYPYEILAKKGEIISGYVINPLIEEKLFITKIWHQNCGDSLRIVRKTNEKQNGTFLWKCEFQKYFHSVKTTKKQIILGTVENPQIEIEEFINKIWHQNCGDSLRILEKTDQKNKDAILYKCEFIKYPYIILATKQHIKNGGVENLKIPHKTKEGILDTIKFLNKRPTLLELANKLNISTTHISCQLKKYELQEYINYYPTESNCEKEIREFCLLLNNSTEKTGNWSLLKEREIDIYIKNVNLGIEFNGNYWHSEINKENNYHQEKSLLALQKNISLIHIWEWEWYEKQNILKSLIKSKLGIFDKKIGASKCKVKEIKYKEYQKFCNNNHLQGECGAKVKLGLFYKEELIQIISFGSPRFTDKYEWEIIRESSKLGWFIMGGKEKLWSHFVKNYKPNSVISYCDFGKFTGDSYFKLGFKKERLNKPGFVWWDSKNNICYLRTPAKHQEYKKEGYIKLYDCGQLVFSWGK